MSRAKALVEFGGMGSGAVRNSQSRSSFSAMHFSAADPAVSPSDRRRMMPSASSRFLRVRRRPALLSIFLLRHSRRVRREGGSPAIASCKARDGSSSTASSAVLDSGNTSSVSIIGPSELLPYDMSINFKEVTSMVSSVLSPRLNQPRALAQCMLNRVRRVRVQRTRRADLGYLSSERIWPPRLNVAIMVTIRTAACEASTSLFLAGRLGHGCNCFSSSGVD
jgi:hypothetical protein